MAKWVYTKDPWTSYRVLIKGKNGFYRDILTADPNYVSKLIPYYENRGCYVQVWHT